MLGRLARWLRFLGFDTLYYPHVSDIRLVKFAMEQERIVLTRDTALVRRKSVRDYVLIHANEPYRQLREVLDALGLRRFSLMSRCVACNGSLAKVSGKAELMDSVPEFVFLTTDDFYRCTECGKLYWEGSHPKQFREKIGSILA